MQISEASSLILIYSVVPVTLIDMMLKLESCYSQWPPRTYIINSIRPPLFEQTHS